LHDIGKVLPKFQRNKIGNKDYQPFDVEIDLDHSIFSTMLINKNELLKELGNEDYANFALSAVVFHHWRDRFEEIIRFGSEKFKKFRDKPLKFKEALIENLMIETKNLKNFKLKLIQLDEFVIEGLADGVPFDSYVSVPYQLYFLPQRLENDDEKKKEWLLISGFLMRCDHFASFC